MVKQNNYIKRISRELYNECINNTNAIKAIAMLIYIKENHKCSVIKKFTYKRLSIITGLTVYSTKKRMHTLKEMGLYDRINDGNDIIFKKIRAKISNVRLDKIDMSSIKSIETGLRALYIVEVQRRKDYVKSAVELTNKVHNGKEYKKALKERNRVLRGACKYTDNGISYNYLAKKMNISKKTVSEAIKYGETNGLFKKEHNYNLIKAFNDKHEETCAFNYFKSQKGKVVMIGLNLFCVAANLYSIMK